MRRRTLPRWAQAIFWASLVLILVLTFVRPLRWWQITLRLVVVAAVGLAFAWRTRRPN